MELVLLLLVMVGVGTGRVKGCGRVGAAEGWKVGIELGALL